MSRLVAFTEISLLVHVMITSGCVLCLLGDPSGQQSSANVWTPNGDSWNYWWSYSGVSGPDYWGLLNPDWFMCDQGRRQSPINIETDKLVYDPYIGPLRMVDNNLISALMYNDGHAIVLNASIPVVMLSSVGLVTSASNIPQSEGNNTKGTSSESHKRRALGASYDASHSEPHVALIQDQLDGKANFLDLSISQSNQLVESFSKLKMSKDSNSHPQVDPPDIKGTGSGTGNDAGLASNEAGSMSMLQKAADGLSKSAGQVESESTEIQTQANRALPGVSFSGGGLIYSYKFEALYLRFGLPDAHLSGSEHKIDSQSYNGELQLICYNSQLYKSFLEASTKPLGLLGISVFLEQLPENQKSALQPNQQLEALIDHWHDLKHRGSSLLVQGINLTSLLPEMDYFVTYDGSLTMPGCQETVTWLVLNKPLYLSRSSLENLRLISADESQQSSAGSSGTLIAGNLRPVQPVNNRPIRTNIKPAPSIDANQPELCPRLRTRYKFSQASKGHSEL